MTRRNTLDEQIRTDAAFACLTPETVEQLLAETGLTPKQGWAWLARALQGALFAARTPPDLSPDRRENKDVRGELFAVAAPLVEASRLLNERSHEFDSAVWDAACHGFEPQGLTDEPPDYRTFNDAVHHVEWLSVFLRRAGMMLEVQKPQWRGSARFAERVWRAQCLSVVYALAFDKEPTVNNWETAKHRGLWWDFYQAVVSLVYGEHSTPNLLQVLKAARRRDKLDRVQLGAGILPD